MIPFVVVYEMGIVHTDVNDTAKCERTDQEWFLWRVQESSYCEFCKSYCSQNATQCEIKTKKNGFDFVIFLKLLV